MDKLRNVLNKLPRRSPRLFSSIEEALNDSSNCFNTFSLKEVDLTSRLKVEDRHMQGGLSDVYVGQLRAKGSKTDQITVSVKVFRLYTRSDDIDKVSFSYLVYVH